MIFKKTFLKLTEYTIPFGEEDRLIPYLRKRVSNLRKDSIGNYYTIIGDSETLFTTHLDTYSTEMQKVNHVVNGNFIETDKKTILGGDNKNGMTILLYMIEKNIPGTYYFFIGEEPILSGGLYGSRNALHASPEFFSKFKRAIAFDRKEYGSVVIRQMARKCCSDEFADALVNELSINGVESFKDMKAYYTDTATFMDIIPEITNISAGGFGEHTKDEKTDISYLEKVAKAASKVKWEELPTVRTPGRISMIDKIKKFAGDAYFKTKDKKIKKLSEKTFNMVNNILDMFGYRCLNDYEFDTGVYMVFSHWHKDSEIFIKIIGKEIYMGDKKVGESKEFKEMLNVKFDDYISEDDLLRSIYEYVQKQESFELSYDDMDIILDDFYSDKDELIEFMKKNKDSLINQYIIVDEQNKLFVANDFSDEE
jgi:hypothetical protein